MHIEVLEKPNLKKVKMNVDDIIDDKLLKYPMVEDLFSRTSFNVILGKMGQGKTSLITNLVKTVFKRAFEHIIVFIPSGSRRSIDNDIYGKQLPAADLYGPRSVARRTRRRGKIIRGREKDFPDGASRFRRAARRVRRGRPVRRAARGGSGGTWCRPRAGIGR